MTSTASAFANAGLPTLHPTRRGGDDSAAAREGFFGEVDDVIAATRGFAALPEVDPAQIYLVGHSTGGTLALLTAARQSALFKEVHAYGPVGDISHYGPPFDTASVCEQELRSPKWFVSSITTRRSSPRAHGAIALRS